MNTKPIEKELLDSKGNPVAWLVENQLCSKCSNNAIYYYEQFDASFCATCNEWAEGTCTDTECEYCSVRPAKPQPFPVT